MSEKILGVRSERMPSDADFTSEWRILRTPTNGRSVKIIIHSADMLGMRTHHWMRRTGPCFETNCEPCQRGQASRWYGYILGALESGERVIFEFPPPAGKQLDAAFQKYGTMRGLCIIASRTTEKFNAKVHIQERGLWNQTPSIKDVPETWPVLARIWGLTIMPAGVVGPMQAQQVSDAEYHADAPPLVPAAKRCQVPTRSLLQEVPPAEYIASVEELQSRLAQSAFLNGKAIDRVNGRKKK